MLILELKYSYLLTIFGIEDSIPNIASTTRMVYWIHDLHSTTMISAHSLCSILFIKYSTYLLLCYLGPFILLLMLVLHSLLVGPVYMYTFQA